MTDQPLSPTHVTASAHRALEGMFDIHEQEIHELRSNVRRLIRMVDSMLWLLTAYIAGTLGLSFVVLWLAVSR